MANVKSNLRTWRLMLVTLLLATALMASMPKSWMSWIPAAHAAGSDEDRSKELGKLREQFKSRYAELEAKKREEAIGETWRGLVAPVKPASVEPVEGDEKATEAAAKLKELIDAENVDRQRLYEILADVEKTQPGKVAARNALRSYRMAKHGEWYLKYAGKDEDGKALEGEWVQMDKKDEDGGGSKNRDAK